MPLYEFLCTKCGAREEVFTRRMQSDVAAPACPKAGREKDHTMRRVISPFAQHLDLADKIAEAEARYGKEVDAAMGPEPDVGAYARRYADLAKNLPSERDV